jgi:hypothetical protein
LFCCGRNSIAKCTPSRSRPGHRQVAADLGAAGEQHGIEFSQHLLGGERLLGVVGDFRLLGHVAHEHTRF